MIWILSILYIILAILLGLYTWKKDSEPYPSNHHVHAPRKKQTNVKI